MVTFADTSFLFSLYGNDVHSPRALAWIRANKAAICLSSLGEFELANALRFAEFRKSIATGEAALFWAQFETDRTCGRLSVRICNLASVVDEAKIRSKTHTLAGGHRGFDILHVAAALTLGAHAFLTFDGNQKKLAEAAGLQVPI